MGGLGPGPGGGWGIWLRRVSRPIPRGEVGGSGGCSGPHLRGSRPTPGVQGPHLEGGVSQHALRKTATAVSGTHPTGMHSCFEMRRIYVESLSSDKEFPYFQNKENLV